MTTINQNFRISNVLTTVDTSILITITESITEQEIYTDEPMTEGTTGKYSFEFEDTDVDLKYTYVITALHNSSTYPFTGTKYGDLTLKTYSSPDDAQTYFDDHLRPSPWDNATEAQQLKALIEATRRLDGLAYQGEKTAASQVREFPRGGDTVVPNAIIEAQYDIALVLLDGGDPELDSDLSVTDRVYSGVRTSWDRSIPAPWLTTRILSATAWDKLIPYLRNSKSVRLDREN